MKHKESVSLIKNTEQSRSVHFLSLEEVLKFILENIRKGETNFFLKGDVGSGKTFLINSLLERIGIEERISSSSFVKYQYFESDIFNKKHRISHFDFYQIKSKDKDIYNLFIESCNDDLTIVFAEWPDSILNNLLITEQIYKKFLLISIDSKGKYTLL